MGFDTHWIKLKRECISSVQYRVLLNGQPRGLIIPKRGPRQGDPLSRSTQVWIIYFGGCRKRMSLAIFHGYYSIYRSPGMIKSI